MSTKPKRITFAVTPEIESLMDKAKQMFCDRTQSDIIRILINAGLDSLCSKGKRGALQKLPDNKGESIPHDFIKK